MTILNMRQQLLRPLMNFLENQTNGFLIIHGLFI